MPGSLHKVADSIPLHEAAFLIVGRAGLTLLRAQFKRTSLFRKLGTVYDLLERTPSVFSQRISGVFMNIAVASTFL